MTTRFTKALQERAARRTTTRYTDANAQALREAMGPGYATGVTEGVIGQATRR